jgi:hypothetical protein
MTGTLQSLTIISKYQNGNCNNKAEKNLKYLFNVEQLRGITAMIHGHHQEISGNFVVCRQLSSLLVSSLKNEKYVIISTKNLISY